MHPYAARKPRLSVWKLCCICLTRSSEGASINWKTKNSAHCIKRRQWGPSSLHRSPAPEAVLTTMQRSMKNAYCFNSLWTYSYADPCKPKFFRTSVYKSRCIANSSCSLRRFVLWPQLTHAPSFSEKVTWYWCSQELAVPNHSGLREGTLSCVSKNPLCIPGVRVR